MRWEYGLVLGIIILSGILICLLQGINPLTLLAPHLPQLDAITNPLAHVVTPLLDIVKPIWQSIKDNPISHSVTTLGTTAMVSIIGKYLTDYALRKKDEAHQLLDEKKDALLANHNGEIEQLTEQRDQTLALAEQFKQSLDAKDEQLAAQDALIEELRAREQALIEERNAATRVDIDKVADEVKEKLAVQ